MLRLMKVALIAPLVAAAFVAFSGQANAQYPPPTGNVTVAGPTAAPLSAVLPISITVRDAAGSAVPSVACELAITRQPGADASVSPATATTNEAGVISAQLSSGSTPGTVEVGARCGALSANLVVQVGGSVAPPSTGSGLVTSSTAGIAGMALAALFVVVAGLMLRTHGTGRRGIDS